MVGAAKMESKREGHAEKQIIQQKYALLIAWFPRSRSTKKPLEGGKHEGRLGRGVRIRYTGVRGPRTEPKEQNLHREERSTRLGV